MGICFESDKNTLIAAWTRDNCSLSTIEYIECWMDILRNIDTLNPKRLLINTWHFGYRTLPEIDDIFNSISQKMGPENIAFIVPNNILGRETLNILFEICPLKGHAIIDNSHQAQNWLNSWKSNPTLY